MVELARARPHRLRPVRGEPAALGGLARWRRGSCSACRWRASALRMMRASMTEVLDEDYLRTAMAKGLRHAHRRAAPRGAERGRAGVQLTTVTMPIVVTNLVLIEQVFSIPGVFTGHAARDRGRRLRPPVRADRRRRGLRRRRRPARRLRARLARPAGARDEPARAWAGFAAMSLLWGIPYLFIKIAVDGGMPPAFIAWVRVTLAAAILLALAWRAGLLGSLRGRWRWVLVYAIVEIVIPFPLIAFGEERVTSSLAAIVIAAVPLFIALLAIRFDPEERATGRRLVGPRGRARRRRRADGDRRRRQARGDDRRGRAPDRRARLRDRADDAQGEARRARPARDDGREPPARRARADAVRGARPAPRGAERRRGDRAGRARDLLHGDRVRDLRRADRRDRPGPRARDHLRQPGRRGRARRR